ncbi:uncharacterized protein KY384_006862 [Bacidia gigantensis]|uniref:uncharacterized protein n=1 Tax=Bacidia gigantensis TaxID=2732470 RepID=UPI001D03DEFE|nr:uncharacterized protein KY384_006862 [Bacidia gigantensis]KAG8527946.1 hypothetical protein KY384_006862 [Bacidia gigantensis]
MASTPTSQSLFSTVPSLEESIKEIGRLVKEPSDLDEAELPGLDVLINDWYDENVDVGEEEFMRRILGVFRNSSHNEVYDEVLEQYEPSERRAINSFVAGQTTAEDAAKIIVSKDASAATAGVSNNELHTEVFSTQKMQKTEFPKKAIKGFENTEFQNWGRTVKQTPAKTYYPENTAEVQTIVREAAESKMGVRVSGFRHSWSPIFGRDNKNGQKNNGDVLISTLTEKDASKLPNFTSLPSSLFQPKKTELNNISEVNAAYVHGQTLKDGKKYVRVGTSTTNEEFRRWCINDGHVTLPMNIIEVEITMGGSNSTICHGAGINHPTLSDLVRSIEYVDVNGEVRNVDMADPDLLKSASGCFGLLGVITHITFECDPISTAVMRPQKLEVIDAVPPPPDMKDSDIPGPLRKPRSQKERQIAQENFEKRANNDYYAEWFWFPYSSLVWVNTWAMDPSTKNVVEYPSKTKTVFQVFGTIAMNIAQNIVAKIDALQFQPLKQTTFLSWLAMKNLDERKDSEKPIRALLPDALHFQRGVQNIRVRDLEVELPLHAKKGTTSERDYTNVQRAWWDAIVTCYANTKTCPMRMPLEMRIMSSSEVTMAPQRGHKLGTCAIEILTLHAAADIWQPYAQQVLNHWTSYKDNDGIKLDIRPHWAKEWNNLEVDGRPWREKLKNESYKTEIAEFKNLLTAIGKKHDWTLSDIKRMFSNDVLDYLYLDDVVVTSDNRTQAHVPMLEEKKIPLVSERVVGNVTV